MKKFFQNILYYILFSLWWLVSKLPLPILYFFSSCFYLIVYHIARYRRKLVRKNLSECFPDKSKDEIIQIEKDFYLYFCDLIAESVKFFSISQEEIHKRMQFEGWERINQSVEEGRSLAIFLGHNCNWEWVSTIPSWMDPKKIKALQLYHPLENPIMDRLVGYERERMGSTNIPMAQSLRLILKHRQEKPVIVGFIGDQVPIWPSLNYWLVFFGKDTPVMTGAERIAQKLDMDCYYIHQERIGRGYYKATFELITNQPKKMPEFWITEEYYRRLEANIKEQPSYWLWTHRRWKRTRQGFIERAIAKKHWSELATARFCDHEHPEGKLVTEWAKENGIVIPTNEKTAN